MKKAMAVLLALAVLAACCGVCAESPAMQSVYIPEKKISVSVPEDYFVVTSETEALPPALMLMGLTLDAVQALMRQGSLLMYAFAPDFTHEVQVLVDAGSDWPMDPNKVSDEQMIADFEKGGKKQFEATGYTLDSVDIYRNGKDVFYRLRAHNDQYHVVQYLTAVDGQHILVQRTNYVGDFTPEQIRLTEQMMDASDLRIHERD